MILKIIKWIVVFGFLLYAWWSLGYAKGVVVDRQCKDISLNIYNEGSSRLIESKEVLESIKNNKVTPMNKTIDEIDLLSLEELILTNQIVKSAICYHTTNGNVRIELHQISPILRIVIGDQNWFVDFDGKIVELDRLYPYRIQVATGMIDDQFVKNYLYPFALELYGDSFWRNQIQQIVITDKKECVLIPLVGDFVIEIGTLTQTAKKIDHLKTFLKTVPGEVGWNYYSKVSIKNNNQIVCKRREK